METRGLKVPALRRLKGPRDDDELWQAVYELTGYKIPRVAVCKDHTAPFTIFADVYFGRRRDVLVIGNRGGGKTTIAGFLHGAKCRWNPGHKSAIVGANEQQGDRGYAEFKRFSRSIASEIIDTLRKKTAWWNGSILEVLTGTLKQVNGPHPHLAQFDEAELTDEQVFAEFQNMAQGDDFYPAQNLLTTTRKFAHGIIQGIVREVAEAIKAGDSPPWDVVIFCVFETMKEVPNCQRAPEKERKARLKELGIDPCSTCDCHLQVKGEWEDGGRRTFDEVCGGRAFRSRGFLQLADAWARFKRLSREVWEAQMECLRPDPTDLIHRWMRGKYVLPDWYPLPELGMIFRTWDWGGDNPHAVLFLQRLDKPVKVKIGGKDGHTYELPEGAIIQFDEIYYSGGGAHALGKKVAERTAEWRQYGFQMRIEHDFCDPAGYTQKRDAKLGMQSAGENPGDFTSRPAPRIESIQKHREWGEDGLIYVVAMRCPNTMDEYASYHRKKLPDSKNISEDAEKKDDHAMDSKRYGIWNLYVMGYQPERATPSAAPRQTVDPKSQKRPPMLGGNYHPEGKAMKEDQLPASGTGYMNDSPFSGVGHARGREYISTRRRR